MLDIHALLLPPFCRTFPLLLLDKLPAFPQPVPILSQPIRQPLALEIRQDARNDRIQSPEHGYDDVVCRTSAKGRECGRDDDLSEIARVDHRGGEVELEAGCFLLGDDARVDA